MERQDVLSSNIKSFGYNINSKTMEIEFFSGDIYEYYNVDESVNHEFKDAISKGKFFNRSINGKYEAKKIFSPPLPKIKNDES